MKTKAFLAASEFEKELRTELGSVSADYGRLLMAESAARVPVWAQNIWESPQMAMINSAADAASLLRAQGRNWTRLELAHSRLGDEIERLVPSIQRKLQSFLGPLPPRDLGAWTLLGPKKLLFSPRTSHPFPHGEMTFAEDRRPPNRAYLKLWEFFTLYNQVPEPGASCLDLGASPGGWTWVLHSLGCRVTAVDKAPLAPFVAKLKGVQFMQESAFALAPEKVGPVDWLFSDVICYPERLLDLVRQWIASGQVRNFVCTIKFQGATDFATLDRFLQIPGSQAAHLHHNKHEVMWWRCLIE